MANPIIKIKTGNTKPADYSQTLDVQGNLSSTSGLTAGELGVNLTPGNYAFYIGNNLGKAITFGCEIAIASDLGGASSSDFKIATQKALKTYVDSSVLNPPSQSQIVSRYSNASLPVSANSQQLIRFGAIDYQTTPAIPELLYGSGTFTNNSSSTTLNLLVIYQITWSGFTTSAPAYNSREIVRSGWIQKSYTGSVAADNVYGFTSVLCPPLLSSAVGAITATQNGSAVIQLDPGQSFAIYGKHHGTGATTIVTTASVNLTGTFQTNFNKATNIQIVKL
jgi:hypothetical protein